MKFSTLSAFTFALMSPILVAGDLAAIVKEIAPNSENCQPGGECRTAEQAAPFIEASFKKYDIIHPEVQAALIALMAFESVEFQYKHNVSPGRPGQGTANMQMAPYNFEYGNCLPDVQQKISQAGFTSADNLSDDQLNEVLSWVTVDEHNFGSAAWYITKKCPYSVREALKANIDAGFATYITECVGTTLTDDRIKYLTAAKQAFAL
ncbi:hypothetical protein BGZ63DRAFT_50825 [Mariannaea sp. PMI_226]|nr:hypothetical protein BGZ63DRAFT_50825 [Mariannaea sp. PMI_226]